MQRTASGHLHSQIAILTLSVLLHSVARVKSGMGPESGQGFGHCGQIMIDAADEYLIRHKLQRCGIYCSF